MTAPQKIVVVGAGPAGLTAAYELSKSGMEVEVFEAGDVVGGMARSIRLWGQTVDMGPHRFFSDDARVNRLWLEVVGGDYQMVDRLTRIFYRQRFFAYPLEPVNALWNLGLPRAFACLASYARQHWANLHLPAEPASFEDWVTRQFGRRLYEEFFKDYSEKLWGIPCNKLDADFAAQRIRRFSLAGALQHALGMGKARHRTLADRFAYPLFGTGMVYERMAAAITRRGGRIRLGTRVKEVIHWEHRVKGVELEDGEVVTCDHVVSTMPLTAMVSRLAGAPPGVLEACRSLTYRNTILVYLRVAAERLFPDQWLYINSPEVGMGRVTNYRNWVPSLYGDSPDTILSCEYWCQNADPAWHAEDRLLIDRAESEIRWTGLLGEARVVEGHVVRIPRCYPVYSCGYKNYLKPIIEYLRGFKGLTPIGRYGSFKYNNQDHSILMGMLAAENLMGKSCHELWEINSTFDSYHEEAVPSEVGLEPGPVSSPRLPERPRESAMLDEPVADSEHGIDTEPIRLP